MQFQKYIFTWKFSMSKWTFNPRSSFGCKLKAEKSIRKIKFSISICDKIFN